MNNIERGIVAKFGGTSLANAERIRGAAEIVSSNPSRRYVVVSAPGKRRNEDQKITDLLFQCNSLVEQGLSFDQAFEQVSSRFEDIGRDLQCHSSVAGWLNEVYRGTQSEKGRDWIASRGEWIMAQVFAKYLGGVFIDAVKLIRLRNSGEIEGLTYKLIKDQLSAGSVYVIPGFYGRNEEKKNGLENSEGIQLFARGGSDITGAIIAKGVNARLYENWTDTDGVKAADPRIISNPRTVEKITHKEMRELAYRGADVLQMDAVLPALEAGIPINVRNTFNPDYPGTMVVTQRNISPGEAIIGIAGRKGFISFQIEKSGMNRQKGITRRILQIFEENDISFDHVPTGLDSISVIFRKDQIDGKKQELLEALKKEIKPDTISVVDNIGLACAVGQGIAEQATDVHAVLFSALKKAGIATLAESYSIKGNNIVIAVDNEKVSLAIRTFYNAFIER